MSLKLVIIEWEDSRQPCGQWKWVKDIEGVVVKCKSVGWLIQETKTFKVLASNLGDIEYGDLQCSANITIPKCCITKVTVLDN